MSDIRSFDDRLAQWLGDEAAAVEMPDRVVTATIEQTRGARQVWAPWPGRRLPTGWWPSARLTFAAVAVAVVVLVGTGLVRLPTGPASGPSPSPSPTAGTYPGTIPPVTGLPGRLAFVWKIGQSYDIWTMRPDRSELFQLTSGDVSEHSPAWSPDGSRILFVRESDPKPGEPFGASDLWVMNADGSNQRMLLAGPAGGGEIHFPTWSPDGTKIAFERGNPEVSLATTGVYVAAADGSNIGTVLLDGAHGIAYPGTPIWSPDGETLLIRTEIDLYLVSVDGSNFRRLTTTDKESAVGDWSPDGQWIVFESDLGVGCIYRIHPDGTGMERLTSGCDKGISIEYAPGGASIAWAGGSHGPDDIWVMDAGGGNQRRLTDNRQVTEISWGP